MHLECLPRNSRALLRRLKPVVEAHAFVMAGGTGLALQIGHRLSADLDFFSERSFRTGMLFRELSGMNLAPSVSQEEEGSLTVLAKGTKLSFLYYPYPFAEPLASAGGVPVANVLDIASMKIMAIVQRGAKRDFVDLYFLLQDVPFRKVAENLVRRFGMERINPIHIGKSLVFFNDAEGDPDPAYRIRRRPGWNAIKTFFARNVRQMVLDLENARCSSQAGIIAG